MNNYQGDKIEQYRNNLRVRACGIYIHNDQILMVGHQFTDDQPIFWAPPGGGVLFSEKASDTVRREFLEETSLEVQVGKYLFTNEYIGSSLHAIELFFEVHKLGGTVTLGVDPEFTQEGQNLKCLAFMTLKEIKELPVGSAHSLFDSVQELRDILFLSGML